MAPLAAVAVQPVFTARGVTKTYTMGEVTVHALGDAYRVDVSIVVWEADDVVQVPTSALFRHGPQWAVYAIRDGRARLTPVEIGRQTGRHAEMAGGSKRARSWSCTRPIRSPTAPESPR